MPAYERPWTIERIEKELGPEIAKRLSNDPVHKWRSDTGIELVHREPTKEELERIIANWGLMSDEQKRISDEKSMELFGVTNLRHAKELQKTSGAIDFVKLFQSSKFPTKEELKEKEKSFSVGDCVKVSDHIRCLQKGKIGTIVRIDPEDKHGWKSFIVKFDNKKYGSMGFYSGNIDKVPEKKAQAVDPDKWPAFREYQKEHRDDIVRLVRKLVHDDYVRRGDWALKTDKGRLVGGKDVMSDGDLVDRDVIRAGAEARRARRANCHELAASILDRLQENGVEARRIFVDKDAYNGIPMGHSTVMFQGQDGHWHRAAAGMADGRKSRLGDFDSLLDAIDQYIAVEKANKQTTDDERVDVFDTTDLPFTDRMPWPEYKALARTGERLYHQAKK